MQKIDGQPVFAATDLVGFLACDHRFALEVAALEGLVARPHLRDHEVELLARRGDEHEKRFLADLAAAGRAVVEIPKQLDDLPRRERIDRQVRLTRAAMDAGADVVYQATFFDGRWLGYADFLLRVDTPSRLGDWSYEVADTKLARRTKASAILQVSSYVDQLTAIQGIEPEWLHIALGGPDRPVERFRVADVMAYYRRVKADFETAFAAALPAFPVVDPYPEPVEHCGVCPWVVQCNARRRADDDLSRVAGIGGAQRRALKEAGIRTRGALAVLPLPHRPRLEGTSDAALERVREQARVQVEGDAIAPDLRWEFLLPLETTPETGKLVPDRGFLVLPPPSPGDLFFDIEGDPYAGDDGIEYLFGVLEPALADPDDPARPRFHEIWSRDAAGDVTLDAEKAAFERLVDLLIGRLEADPAMHVYHYAAYEKTALGRLAQRHATREAEVDRLLRGQVLVDLYRVVRQGLRVGVESYSIKKLEPLYGLRREVDLRSAGSSIVQFEQWLEGVATDDGHVGEAILREIAGYNRDDVVSNWRLRDWLEARRADLAVAHGADLPRPQVPAEAGTTVPDEHDALVARLTDGIPADPAARSADEQATWLAAQLLGWHRREDKAFWWRYFELCKMTDEDLVDEKEPIGQLTFLEDLGPTGRGSRLERYAFPPQDTTIREGRSVHDPRTTEPCGTVDRLDVVEGIVVLRRSAAQVAGARPTSLVPQDLVRTDSHRASLAAIGTWIADHGVDADGPYRAARDLLLRLPPRGAARDGEALALAGEDAVEAACRLTAGMRGGCLAIQGPPGSGKTYAGAHIVLELVRLGRRVGVTANSHKVIGNLLDKIHEEAEKRGRAVRIGQRTGDSEAPTSAWAAGFDDNPKALAALRDGIVDVMGGTSWLWSRAEFAGSVDVLIVDEAGQMSLANAVAVSPAADSIVLLGDPQQLDQPMKGSHPPGAERSALGHLLDGRPTVPDGLGLFLPLTWRLHPDLTGYTSEIFYSGELRSEPSLQRQSLAGVPPLDGTGLRWAPVAHRGRDVESPEEAEAIAEMVGELVRSGATWTDRHGETRPVGLEDVVIVAPYNAHVARIAEVLEAAGLTGARVGTVDKFQGQEAPISIYAMGSSSAEDAPRGMEFLYSMNRLNVATSRARCAAIVVASPALIRVNCHTPRQIQLANALCRLVEVAEPAEGRGAGDRAPVAAAG